MKTMFFFMSILAATLAHAAESAHIVVVRTYNYARLTADELTTPKSEAEQIFRRAGISLEWIACRVPKGDEGALCTEPLLAGRDLMLRLVERIPASGERIVVLGESMLDHDQRRGVLMTVDLFPVRAVASGASTSWSILLGRAIAHEIGHLLLGTADHPRAGLMRALWSHDELRGLKPTHWGFSSLEAAQMRHTLRQRSRVAD